MNSEHDGSQRERMTLDETLAGLDSLREELRLAREEATLVAKVKDDFLSRISHELRTPLNAIMGIGELMHGAGLSDKQATYLSMIRESTSQLSRLVDKILDFSQLQDQKAQPVPEEFLFRDALEPAFVQYRLKARDKGLDLFVHVDRDMPEQVEGFPRWIFQVFSILAENAVKFTDHGEVLIRFYPLFSPPKAQKERFTLCMCVTDTGIGVPVDKQEMIFQQFVTVHESSKYDGIGMGLALAEKLVARMNGRIWVDSELYLGSTFYVSLPLRRMARPEDRARPLISGPFRILLAEDEPVNRYTTVHLLKRQGHHIDAVGNGRQALEALSRKEYDLVLMDVSMPEMDGLEATRAIRSGQAANVDPDIPIIALTALVMPADKQRCLDAGMNAYAPKPVETKKLQDIMAQALAGSRRTPGGGQATGETTRPEP